MKKLCTLLVLIIAITSGFVGCSEQDGSSSDFAGANWEDFTYSSGNDENDATQSGTSSNNGSNTQTGDGNQTTVANNSSNTQTGDGNQTTVAKKEYTIKAKGSEYAKDIYLPKLSKKEATIYFMTNTDWDYIKAESTKNNPTAYYHAMKVWKETYGVDVNIELVSWGDFTNHLITSVSAGEGPDVVRYATHPTWITSNLLTPLDDKLDLTDPDYSIDQMEKYSIKNRKYVAFAKPLNMPTHVLVYNKTKFENAGEKTPLELYKSGQWNFTNFVKAAKNLTSEADDEYGFTGAYYEPTSYPILRVNKDNSISNMIDDAKFQKWYATKWDLYNTQKAVRPMDKRGDAHNDTYPAGKDAMVIVDSIGCIRLIENAKKQGTKDEFGIVPLPVEDSIGETLPRGSNETFMEGAAVSLNARNQSGAVEFVRLMVKISANISEQSGEFCGLTDFMSNEEKDIFRKVKYEDYLKGGIRVVHTGLVGFSDVRNNYFLPTMYSTNTTTVPETLGKAKGPLNEVIKEYEISIGLKK